MKANILVIGDIHGTDHWKKIIKDNPAEHIFFLGDYCDSFDYTPRQCIDNMKQIFKRAKKNPGQYNLCIGNHDYHYLRITKSKYSGFNEHFYEEYRDTLLEYKSLLHMAFTVKFTDSSLLISHAGVSNTFLKRNELTVESLEDAWKNSPEIFDFDYINYTCGHGDDIFQSPIWIRPYALLNDMVPGYNQIVGHTLTKRGEPFILEKDGNKLIVVCTHKKNNYITA